MITVLVSKMTMLVRLMLALGVPTNRSALLERPRRKIPLKRRYA
jgi:hypothetical protein